MTSSTEQPIDSRTADLQVPMPDVIRFVRQLSHDLRNHLNAAELQSAYVHEVAEDPELKDEVKRLRGMLTEMGGSLQKLTGSLAQVKLTEMPYEAAAFLEDLRTKIGQQSPEQSAAIDWDIKVSDAVLNIDPQILQQAMLELIANAFTHERGDGQIKVLAEQRDGEFRFTLQEPKTGFSRSTENWGREPFQRLTHGHYSLGLVHARSIVEAHRGQLSARYDSPSSSLVTTLVLPTTAGQ